MPGPAGDAPTGAGASSDASVSDDNAVAGTSSDDTAAAEGQEEGGGAPQRARDPSTQKAAQWAEHQATHSLFRSGCPDCVA
eukprot:11435155-Alexandrium_andersonii.AAC.1